MAEPSGISFRIGGEPPPPMFTDDKGTHYEGSNNTTNQVGTTFSEVADGQTEGTEPSPMMFTDEGTPYEGSNVTMNQVGMTFSEVADGPTEREVSDGEAASLTKEKQMTKDPNSEKVLEEDDDDDDDEIELQDDVYSMMFVANWKSLAFWYAFLVFGLQVMILALAGYDLLEDDPGEEDENKFNVPEIVETPVIQIAQGCALLIAVLSQDDITQTLLLVSVGCSSSFRQFLPSLHTKYPGGATQVQFWLANTLRLCEGLLVVVVSFIFIVQADNVLDIFLNFAAIEFVSELDNLGYNLAKEGWIGDRIKLIAKKIEGDTLPARKKDQRWARHLNLIILLSLLLVLYGGWGYVYSLQTQGVFVEKDACSTVRINFGDEVYFLPPEVEFESTGSGNETKIKGSDRLIGAGFDFTSPPDLHYAYFSGKYKADFDNRAGNSDGIRPVYYESSLELGDNHDDPTLGIFYYCNNRWVFSIRAFLTARAIPLETQKNGCRHGWLMRSPITNAETLDEVPSVGWRIWTGALNVASDFSISCIECNDNLDCGLNRGECNTDSSTCECNNGSDGDFCNEDEACGDLALFDEDGTQYAYYYYALENDDGSLLKAYGRQVYFTWLEPGLELVIYTGRRWYDTYFGQIEDVDRLGDDTHAYWGNLLLSNTKWYSQTTDSFIPTGPLQWFKISLSQDAGNYGPFGLQIEFPQRFECLSVDCSSRSRICGAAGQCKPNQTLLDYNGQTYLDYYYDTAIKGGVCKCDNGFRGHFCDFERSSDSGTEAPSDSASVAPTPTQS